MDWQTINKNKNKKCNNQYKIIFKRKENLKIISVNSKQNTNKRIIEQY